MEDYIMVQIFTAHPIGRAVHHLYKVENFRILFISGDYKEIGWLNINYVNDINQDKLLRRGFIM